MTIGERIQFLRKLRGMTQKYLGMSVGFPERNADVRIAQYESGTRTPKNEMVKALAEKLDVSPSALEVPEIESNIGLMHTFFALEDTRGIRVGEIDGKLCLRLDESQQDIVRMFYAWEEQSEKLAAGEITKEEYDQWRYNYPDFDTTQNWTRIYSEETFDLDNQTNETNKKEF